MNQFRHYHLLALAWAYISGAICFTTVHVAFGQVINSSGNVNDYWNCGATIVLINIFAHHVMVANETRNYTWFNGVAYVLSFLSLPLVIILNDISDWSEFYMNQWTVMVASPLFVLVLFLNVFIIMLPRLIELVVERVIRHPEFTKIKAN